jgi:hypothetical protein
MVIHAGMKTCEQTMTDSRVKIGPKKLATVEESAEDNADEYIGNLVFSTTGDVLVPRDWLREQWDALELSEKYFPSQTSRWQAYRRTMRRLLDDPEQRIYDANIEGYERSFTNQFEIEKSADMGSNVFILYSKTFFPEELIGEEGGDWRRQRIGYFDFFRPEDGDAPGQMIFHTDMDKEGVHYERAKELRGYASTLFRQMQNHHNKSDLQKVIDQVREEADAIPIRRAVHFIPAHYTDLIEGLATVWGGLNEFKQEGEEVRIETTPVVNLAAQREMVADRVEKEVRGMVDNIIEETMEKFAEEAEVTADETAREILNQLGDSGGMAGTYNQLLQMKLSVKDILKEHQKELGEEQEEIIEKVLNQTEIEDYE